MDTCIGYPACSPYPPLIALGHPPPGQYLDS